MFLMLLLRVWHVHNELTHQKKPAPVEASKRFLMSFLESLMLIKQHLEVHVVSLWFRVCRISDNRSIKKMDVKLKWQPPKEDTTKLNVDGAFTPDGKAGAEMILRNHKGEVIAAACRQLMGCDDALEVELAAIEEGIGLAIQWTTGPWKRTVQKQPGSSMQLRLICHVMLCKLTLSMREIGKERSL
ncbi:hypothetical protein ACQ4PT_008932 [Festuca glaucescens]